MQANDSNNQLAKKSRYCFKTKMLNAFGDKQFMKACAKLFFPAIIEVILITSVNYFDSFFLAAFTPNSMGALAKTATVLANQLIFVPTIIFMAIAAAGGIMASQYYGKNNIHKFKECINFMLLCSLATNLFFVIIFAAIPLQMIGLLSGTSIVNSNDPNVIANFKITNELAATYLRFQCLTLIPYLFSFIMGIVYRQDNAVIVPLIGTIIAVSTNIILDPILIIYAAKDANQAVMYVALATLAARGFDALFLLVMTLIRKNKPYFFFNYLKLSRSCIKSIFINGWQIFLNEIVFAVGTVLLSIFFLHYNQQHRDSIATVTLIVQFTTLIWPGANTVVAVLVLAKLGANQINEAKANTKKLINWAIIVGVVLAVILFAISFFVNDLLNPPLANTKEAIVQAKVIATTAMHLEWIIVLVILAQAPSSVLYFCIRGGGSKWLLCIDTLTICIWVLMIGLITNVNVPANPLYKLHPVLLFFIIEMQHIFKLVVAAILMKYTKWANNLAQEQQETKKEIHA